jgi:MFS family permease
VGHRLARRFGPGPLLVSGFGICGAGWLLLALAPLNAYGVAAYPVMLLMYGMGAVFIFINFLALRQSVTPGRMLGRMTSTMRWLILLPAGPGALWGGWLGEHYGLRAPLGFAGVTGLLLAFVGWRLPVIRSLTALPTFQAEALAPFSSERAR